MNDDNQVCLSIGRIQVFISFNLIASYIELTLFSPLRITPNSLIVLKVPAKIFKSFNAVILKMEDLKVGADSIDVLDLLQLLLVQRDLFQRVEGPIVVFSSAHQKLVRYANHLEQ